MTRKQPDATAGVDTQHPVLTAPHTKEQWRRYMDSAAVPRPERPESFNDYLSIAPTQRQLLQRKRTRFHSSFVIVKTPTMQRIHEQMRYTMLLNEGQSNGALPGLLVDGKATLGKSTIVKTFARSWEQEQRELFPERFENAWQVDDLYIDYTPIVYINIPAKVTPKGLSRRLAQYFNAPICHKRTATADEYTDAAVRAISGCRSEMVIVDDIHFLNTNARAGKDAIDHLKDLQETVAATFMFTGINVERDGLFLGVEGDASEQLSGRLQRLDVIPFGSAILAGDTRSETANAQMNEWASIVNEMEGALDLYHHEPGTLVADWRYLLERTGGRISSLSRLIRGAAVRAIVTGPTSGIERIDRATLDAAHADMLAEDQRRRRDAEHKAAEETARKQARAAARRAARRADGSAA